MAFLQVHDRIVRDALRELAGREIKHTGDGIMACFFSAVAAARCATRIQRALAHTRGEKGLRGQGPDRCRGGRAGRESHGSLRVHSAARVAALLARATGAEPRVERRRRVVHRQGPTFQDLGEVSLKGFERPIRVHAIQHAGD